MLFTKSWFCDIYFKHVPTKKSSKSPIESHEKKNSKDKSKIITEKKLGQTVMPTTKMIIIDGERN